MPPVDDCWSDPHWVVDVTADIVGRHRELEQIAAALATGRHLLLEGPPGTGKSTLLRRLAGASGRPFSFVEGNAELTPARLIGSFDPAAVLNDGYRAEAFDDGPLLAAMRAGGLLYIEEINRVPEETLNAVIGVMSEREIQVPRLGLVVAAPGFRIIAAMNPFDSVGTARLAGAVYDRCCRLVVDYQSADEEADIVRLHASDATASLVAPIVALVRDTRDHPELSSGASVRGAIDTALLAEQLAVIRHLSADSADVTRDAVQMATSGRVQVGHSSNRSAHDIIDELWQRHFGVHDDESDADSDQHDGGSAGKA